jgi:heptaprenylglyceryl phosphate synthase
VSDLLPRYLPLIDPEHFHDLAFYRELEATRVEAVLLGGTGSAHLRDVAAMVREQTRLRVVLYPAGPDSVCPADLVLMPDVMNSNSHFARPFGSGSVATAMAIAKQGLAYLPVAYFILGDSTARWYFDAFAVNSDKLIVGYCAYAKMVGYRHIALDYEDPRRQIDLGLVKKIKQATGLHLTVSDEVTPEQLRELLASGVDTVVTPSNLLETAADPIALIRAFLDAAQP